MGGGHLHRHGIAKRESPAAASAAVSLAICRHWSARKPATRPEPSLHYTDVGATVASSAVVSTRAGTEQPKPPMAVRWHRDPAARTAQHAAHNRGADPDATPVDGVAMRFLTADVPAHMALAQASSFEPAGEPGLERILPRPSPAPPKRARESRARRGGPSPGRPSARQLGTIQGLKTC